MSKPNTSHQNQETAARKDDESQEDACLLEECHTCGDRCDDGQARADAYNSIALSQRPKQWNLIAPIKYAKDASEQSTADCNCK
ncbi:MAG: hypothetical protein AAF939_01335 [Planctomycetota bacterium]